MAEEAPHDNSPRTWVLRELESRFAATLGERADRYLRIGAMQIIADTSFAAASSECIGLFRDGHFYGCVALAQAVGEALVRHMCHSNNFKPGKSFEENLSKLKKRRFISDAVEADFTELWKRRDDYHHLNPSVLADREQLEGLAFAKVKALAQIEAWVFGFSPGVNGIALNNPQYWPREGGEARAFLRSDPAV